LEVHFAQGAEGFFALFIVEVVNEQHPVEVIYFVLKEAGFYFVGFFRNFVAFEVNAYEVNGFGPGYFP
jgi:hypothetical protein